MVTSEKHTTCALVLSTCFVFLCVYSLIAFPFFHYFLLFGICMYVFMFLYFPLSPSILLFFFVFIFCVYIYMFTFLLFSVFPSTFYSFFSIYIISILLFILYLYFPLFIARSFSNIMKMLILFLNFLSNWKSNNYILLNIIYFTSAIQQYLLLLLLFWYLFIYDFKMWIPVSFHSQKKMVPTPCSHPHPHSHWTLYADIFTLTAMLQQFARLLVKFRSVLFCNTSWFKCSQHI